MNKTNRYVRKKVKEVLYHKETHCLRRTYSRRDDNEVNGKLSSQNSALPFPIAHLVQ